MFFYCVDLCRKTCKRYISFCFCSMNHQANLFYTDTFQPTQIFRKDYYTQSEAHELEPSPFYVAWFNKSKVQPWRPDWAAWCVFPCHLVSWPSCRAVVILPCRHRLAVLSSSCRLVVVVLPCHRRLAVWPSPSCRAVLSCRRRRLAVLPSCHVLLYRRCPTKSGCVAAMDENSKISPNVGSYLVYLVRRATDRPIRFFFCAEQRKPSRDRELAGLGLLSGGVRAWRFVRPGVVHPDRSIVLRW
jgi:hypothetical protein